MPFPKGRILCVDDNTDARELVRMMLASSGYDIECVDNPFKALELAKSEKFDLLILDNWMPELIGTELTYLIREFDQTTPILFYSAAAYEADKQGALDAGANAYLTKPNGIDHLLTEVERLITNRQSE
jgi:DNA-binding response OmpR family regulator